METVGGIKADQSRQESPDTESAGRERGDVRLGFVAIDPCGEKDREEEEEGLYCVPEGEN